jgi:drug/metabolite transporter (DMT)-like permease
MLLPDRYITFKAGIGQELDSCPPLSSFRAGYLLVVISAFCFAAGGNLIKALFKLGYSPQLLAQLRLWFAFGWLLVALLLFRPELIRVRRRDLPALAVFGGIGLAGVQLSYYLTIARINIAVALLVQYLGLVGVATWEHYHRRQRVSGRIWGALVLVLAGAFLAVGGYRPSLLSVNLPGVLFGLVSAGFFAFYMLRASSLARRLNTWTMLLYGFGVGGLLWVGYDLASGMRLPGDWRLWVAMAVVGLFGTLLGHSLFVMALRTIRPSSAGIVATAEPVFAGLIAFVVFGDRLELLQLLGAAIIIAGIIAVQLSRAEETLPAELVS